ncbi:hypothetical protein [Nocardia sp. CC227C]|uniref:hypothetical protein n=1 Tax=Nocardia sp. CC227C TaxID=3044562 RepID=UPI00278BD98B|nr:hypothetical protein [Nocardia sp. CC227C]
MTAILENNPPGGLPTCRVTVYLGGPHPDDMVVLEYAATRYEAAEFAAAATRLGMTVTVDARVRPDLRPLPCRRLWRR